MQFSLFCIILNYRGYHIFAPGSFLGIAIVRHSADLVGNDAACKKDKDRPEHREDEEDVDSLKLA